MSDTQYADLLKKGLRIDPRVGGKARAGADIEPEYMALSDDGRRAYVTLQVGGWVGATPHTTANSEALQAPRCAAGCLLHKLNPPAVHAVRPSQSAKCLLKCPARTYLRRTTQSSLLTCR